jgi:superfamily II DNA or RNA helicase
LSGTITDKTHKELYPILTRKVIYYYPIEKAITDGIISNYNIVVYTLPLDNKDAYIESGAANKKFLTTELSNYGYLTKQFNKFRMMSFKDPKFSNMKYKYAGMRSRFIYSAKSKVNLVNRFINSFSSDEPILIFTTLTDVANILNTDTHHSKSNVKSKYVDLTNNDEITNLELFKQGIINRLAVCNMVSMGITIPNLKIAVFHQLQSSPELAQQKILRACNFVSRDTIAQIFIFVYENTVDMDWLQQALEPFDHKKIRYDSFRNIK